MNPVGPLVITATIITGLFLRARWERRDAARRALAAALAPMVAAINEFARTLGEALGPVVRETADAVKALATALRRLDPEDRS